MASVPIEVAVTGAFEESLPRALQEGLVGRITQRVVYAQHFCKLRRFVQPSAKAENKSRWELPLRTQLPARSSAPDLGAHPPVVVLFVTQRLFAPGVFGTGFIGRCCVFPPCAHPPFKGGGQISPTDPSYAMSPPQSNIAFSELSLNMASYTKSLRSKF